MEGRKMESPLPPPKPAPQFSVPSPNTPVQYDRRIHRPSSDICFRCRQSGHWSRECPLNNKSRSRIAPNSNFPNIYCRCGHGFCEVRTTKNGQNCGRSYYVCPIKRGKKCRDTVKWCDDIEEGDLYPPRYTYPICSCRAGVCRRVKATSGPNKGRYFFACPIRKGHGACSYLVWEDTLSYIPDIEDLQDMDMDMNITLNFGDLQDMDMDQGTDFPDVDDSQDIDESISGSWESLVENAWSRLHLSKPSTTHDVSPDKHIQRHEEEKVSLVFEASQQRSQFSSRGGLSTQDKAGEIRS